VTGWLHTEISVQHRFSIGADNGDIEWPWTVSLWQLNFLLKSHATVAFRYGQCVTMGSHSFTWHPHTKHIGLYSPAAWCSSCLPTKGWPGWV